MNMHVNSLSETDSVNSMQLFRIVSNIFLCGFISTLGILGNVMNLIIFYRQGLNTTISFGFFTLAISDLCCLVLHQEFVIFEELQITGIEIPVVYSDMQYLSGSLPREMFSKVASMITLYIIAERCLCVCFPLTFKQMITMRISRAIILYIYGSVFISIILLMSSYSLEWKFYPAYNKTFLGLMVVNAQSEAAIYGAHAISGLVFLLGVFVLTLILTNKLRQNLSWRAKAHISQEKSKSLSVRDKSTMRMTIVIATVFIACYTPCTLLCLAQLYEPEFSISGKYFDIFYIMWSLTLLLENINSSVNIIFYLKMSTKYRSTAKELFYGCT